jgi:hypothetical protein
MKIVAKDIDMVAVTYKGGETRPFRFRLTKDDEATVIKVGKVLSVEETKFAGVRALVFSCQSKDRGELKRYELKYLIDSHKWQLYKI